MPWSVSSYNTDPALNTAINGTDISEGSQAAGYNDALRQIMADIAAWVATGLSTLGGLPDTYKRLIVSNKSTAFSPVDAESSYAYNWTGPAAAMTLNKTTTTPMTPGSTFIVRNTGSGALTITQASGTALYANGATVPANASLAIGGVATLTYWGSEVWTVTGSGLS